MALRSPLQMMIPALAATLVVGAAAPAFAGGFSAARFGGERGNPTEANPFSIYYNPGGLGMIEGTKLTLDGSFVFRNATYERPLGDGIDAGSDEALANSGEGSVSNFLISPAFAVATDFGGNSPVKLGFGFFVPFGGSATWDNTDPVGDFDGAEDGPQRWYTIDGTIQSLTMAAGLGYEIESIGLSLGLSGNLYLNTVDTIRARNSNGSDDPTTEGRSWLQDATGNGFGLGIGALWEAVEDELWIGASYQSKPGFGRMELEGTLRFVGDFESEDDVIITHQLPDIIRLGGRWAASDDLELRLFADYTRWSVMDKQCMVKKSDRADLDDACKINADGSAATDKTPVQALIRNWNDTFGLRLGASYWVVPEFEILLGAGYDSNAIDDANLDPALMDMDKVTASLGLRYDFTEFMALTLTGINVFYFERDTTGVAGNETLLAPSASPANAGVYNQNIFLVNANLDFAF